MHVVVANGEHDVTDYPWACAVVNDGARNAAPPASGAL